jgi:hypothetical protein
VLERCNSLPRSFAKHVTRYQALVSSDHALSQAGEKCVSGRYRRWRAPGQDQDEEGQEGCYLRRGEGEEDHQKGCRLRLQRSGYRGRVAAKTVVAESGHFEDVRSRRREKREKGFADKVDIPESKPQAGWKEVSICGKRKQES